MAAKEKKSTQFKCEKTKLKCCRLLFPDSDQHVSVNYLKYHIFAVGIQISTATEVKFFSLIQVLASEELTRKNLDVNDTESV